MRTLERTDILHDKRLAPLLPLVASVWEDGELTDLEIAAVCMAVIREPDLDLTCREALDGWLDPQRPPSGADLAALEEHLAA